MNLQAPTDIVIYSIEKAIKTYRKFAQNNIRKIESNITVDQVLLLILLQNSPILTQVEIAEVLFKDYASITRMIELMVKNNYLVRENSKEDRRRKELTISEKGKQITKKLFPIILSNRNTALKGLSYVEIEQLDFLLMKIINNCK